jgi:hypothetical protein
MPGNFQECEPLPRILLDNMHELQPLPAILLVYFTNFTFWEPRRPFTQTPSRTTKNSVSYKQNTSFQQIPSKNTVNSTYLKTEVHAQTATREQKTASRADKTLVFFVTPDL